MQNMIDAGFDIFDTHPFTPHGWVGDGQFDYTDTDRYIEKHIEQKRDVLLILRIWMGFDQHYLPEGGISHEPSWYIKYHACLNVYPSNADPFNVTPSFFIKEADAILGKFISYKDGRYAGLGLKNMGEWNSVLSTAPMLLKGVLRNIAKAAGCHVYTDFPGQTFHCKNYVGIYFHESGKCKIKLPRMSTEIKEVWSGKIVAKNTDTIEIDAKINETVLYKY